MPPKVKLHKNSGKSQLKPKTTENVAPAPSTISPETEQQFEIELCWCIQQLQISLKSGKLNQKQVQDHTKSLNTLMSNNAPMIKKRQVMRLTFGDYRSKMSEEDKRLSKGIKIKVSTAKPSSKSVFVKKSLFSTNTDNEFKFNFEACKQESTDTNAINCDTKACNELLEKDKFHFNVSDNAFRFNFDTDETKIC